ncbi:MULTISPECIES: hypothetical protein [Bacillaceae]|uniref:Uncharacterized protein n=1 Tax=Evansella alkalicola TaxID=745819 RepID=A0ABS6K0R9_9BACI|nr:MULTISPECIES: hypothetical protein [Bacillaceae]MBU9723901.1 hypothetical protein [Bacillus alkalicola]
MAIGNEQLKGKMVSSYQLDQRFNELLVQIESLDRKLKLKNVKIEEVNATHNQMLAFCDSLDEFDMELNNMEHNLKLRAATLTK